MVTTGIKPRSQSPVHLFQPCAGGSTDLGLYQTCTSPYPFDTLVTGLARRAEQSWYLPIPGLPWRTGLVSASDSILALHLYIWQSHFLHCILAFAHPNACHLPRELVSAHSRPRPESWACFWRRRGRLSLLFLAQPCVRQQLLTHHSSPQVNANR